MLAMPSGANMHTTGGWLMVPTVQNTATGGSMNTWTYRYLSTTVAEVHHQGDREALRVAPPEAAGPRGNEPGMMSRPGTPAG